MTFRASGSVSRGASPSTRSRTATGALRRKSKACATLPERSTGQRSRPGRGGVCRRSFRAGPRWRSTDSTSRWGRPRELHEALPPQDPHARDCPPCGSSASLWPLAARGRRNRPGRWLKAGAGGSTCSVTLDSPGPELNGGRRLDAACSDRASGPPMRLAVALEEPSCAPEAILDAAGPST